MIFIDHVRDHRVGKKKCFGELAFLFRSTLTFYRDKRTEEQVVESKPHGLQIERDKRFVNEW